MKGFTLGILVAIYSLPSFAAGSFSRVIPSSDSSATIKQDSASRVIDIISDTKTSLSRTAVNRTIPEISSEPTNLSRNVTRVVDVDGLAVQT